MLEVKRFTDKNDLAEAIDNGGRFYHLFSQARDNIVSQGELAKAAGAWASDENAYLFLKIALASLSENDKRDVLGMLQPELRNRFQQMEPVTLKPSEVESRGEVGQAVVVDGFLIPVDDDTGFGGVMYVPIMVGEVTTFTAVPLFDQYDVYHVFDQANSESPNAVVAVAKGTELSRDEKVSFGGHLRELEYQDESARTHRLYLEAGYYMRIG